MKRLYIHAGAHRTGTSSLQMCLHDNRGVLAGAGYDLAYPGRDGIPSGALGLRLPSPRHGDGGTRRFGKKVQEELLIRSPDPDTPLILSEENLIGRMVHFFDGQFYPAAEARLRALCAGIMQAGARPERFVLVVRPYPELFVSGYRKRAEDTWCIPFDQIRHRMVRIERGWPAIIAAIRDLLAPEELIVLPYADRGTSVDLLRRIAPGLDSLDLAEPARSLNVSATDAALIELQARYKDGETLERAAWQAVVDAHAEKTAAQGFAAFTEAEHRLLTARFDVDMEEIAAMQGVTLAT